MTDDSIFVSYRPTLLGPLVSDPRLSLPILDPLFPTFPRRRGLVRNANVIWQAFVAFPNDPVTAWSVIESCKLIDDDTDLTGTMTGQPQIGSFLDNVVARQRNRLRAAEQVGLALIAWPGLRQGPLSFRKAIRMAQAHMLTWPVESQSVPLDEARIHKAFQFFKPSIHLVIGKSLHDFSTAEILSDYDKLRKTFAMAAYVQGILSMGRSREEYWPWVVPPELALEVDQAEFGRLSSAAWHALDTYQATPDRDADSFPSRLGTNHPSPI